MLVLTQWFDPTADDVVRALRDRNVAVFRCDAADFPQRLMMHAELISGRWTGVLRAENREVLLEEITGIYHRRPSRFEFPVGMSAPERQFAAAEARYGFGGLLSALPAWLNHPALIARAEYKPLQLRRAADAGLRVPRTMLTNDPAGARAWCDQVGDVVYKSLSLGMLSEQGEFRVVYTSDVSAEAFGDPAISRTAHLFQERLVKSSEVRLTVVDDRMFAAQIHARTDETRLDWRRDFNALSYTPSDVPDAVRRGVSALMQVLGLRFGALDFAVTEDGDWVFLEINPNGQWAWIEEETGLPISSAIADALEGGHHGEKDDLRPTPNG